MIEAREPYLRDKHSTEYGMNLPEGKACGDCYHIRKCKAIFGHIEADETCDWSPSRFMTVDDLKLKTEII